MPPLPRFRVDRIRQDLRDEHRQALELLAAAMGGQAPWWWIPQLLEAAAHVVIAERALKERVEMGYDGCRAEELAEGHYRQPDEGGMDLHGPHWRRTQRRRRAA